MMNNASRFLLLQSAFLLAALRVFAAQPSVPAGSASEKSGSSAERPTPPAAAVVEPAKADFPYTLQGVFGLPGQADASLRAVGSGKSVWLKPGEKIGGWTLVRVDAEKALVVLSKGGRKVTLHRAGSVAGAAEQASGKSDDFNGMPIVLKKLDDLRRDKNSKVYEFMVEAESKSFAVMKETHPQFMEVDGASTTLLLDKPGASLAQRLTEYDLMLESKSPEADAVRPMVEALRDAALRVLPKDGSTGLSEQQIWGKEIDMWREADRLYKERHPGK